MSEQQAAQNHHITSPLTYGIAFVVLMALFGLTLVVYIMHLGTVLAITLAMIIAVTKATIVVLWFMQVRLGTKQIGRAHV